jgi:hypothetical protein
VRLITAKVGERVALEASEEFLHGTSRATVEISGRPDVQLRSAVEGIIDYPYGCVEQTTSRLYGILYAPDLLLADSPRDARVQEVGRMIRAGIQRLWSMQTRDGGMAYWPGDRTDSLWPSAYVGQFLAEARSAGYPADAEFTDRLCAYLLDKLNEPTRGGEMTDNLRAQICRVLAAFGKPQHGWMNRLSEKAADLDAGGRADLAAAFAATGRKDLAIKVLPEDTLSLTIATSTGGRITSGTAQFASLLSALMDIQPDHPWTGLLAGRLDKSRQAAGHWGTTLENAQCIAALAKYQLAHKEKSEFTGMLTAGGAEHAFDSNRPARLKLAEADLPAAITTTGSGPVYLSVKTEGLARENPKPYDRGLEVRRQWRDLSGRIVDPAKVRVGDLIVAEVYYRAPGLSEGLTVDNVAIVDALPGGVEVENTHLATSSKLPGQIGSLPPESWLAADAAAAQPASTATRPASATSRGLAASRPAALWDLPDSFRRAIHGSARIEWLDDRVVIFANASNSPVVYRYLLRATTSGRFQLPQLQASCMYDPAVASVHGGGEVVVSK